jgi:SAM-dependent methyltransferase
MSLEVALKVEQRTKLDQSNDLLFYEQPRLVTHVDAGFIAQLTDLYRDRLKPNTRVLDLMSSWVSHLPDDLAFEHIEGHGMNATELGKNPRLDHYFVQNLNQNQTLPLPDQSFDAVICTVSVQYLQYPELVFAEVHRVLKRHGVAIFSFSNRMFAQKAIAAWRDGSDGDHVKLVKSYFGAVPGFATPEVIAQKGQAPALLQMFGLAGGDPFYAIVSQRL